MRRLSFFTRLLLGNLLLIGVIIAVSGVASYRQINADYQRAMRAEQARTARIMRHYFQTIWPRGQAAIDAECKGLLGGASMRLTVIAADGTVLGDNQADPAHMVNHKTQDRPEVLAALAGRADSDVRTSETLDVDFRYFAEPIEVDGKVVGATRIAMPIEAMDQRSGIVRNSLVLSALMGGVVAAALAVLLSWIWYSPLRRITLTARAIASGKIHRRVRITGPKELAELGGALNEMSESIADKMRQIEVQRGNLATVVRNLREGVVALDAAGCIVIANTAARRLLDVKEQDVQGRQLQEVVRVADVVTALGRVGETGRAVARQIERDIAGATRILDLLAIPVAEPSAEGIRFLLVVRDVTEQVRTAKVKAEFVANASHELRTPLATIRVAVDSLESVGPGDREEFDKIRQMLDRHTASLEEMANDLLSLHAVETAGQRLRLEEIETGFLAMWAREQFAVPAGEKGVALEVDAPRGDDTIASDLTLVQLILQNLLDNAVKFTPVGGSVACLLKVDGDEALLRVSDTGCGIPAELHDRVFERFFQVEPARSGAARTRGTGLGLAIVKHAAERLGGTVALQSQPGKGTTIEVRLPASASAEGR
jgi:two-component system phosphate regulon sensor histidine kinase PhoR